MGLFGGRGRPAPDEPPLPAPALARILALVERVGAEDRPEDVLDTAVDAAIDLTEAERGWVIILKPDGSLVVAAARRRDGRELEDPLEKISRTIVEQAIREDRPLCVDEAREDELLAGAPSVEEMRLRAVLCVPFRLPDSVGVFYLDNRFAAGVFGAETLRLLSTFAGPVAMILRHSELEGRLGETAAALATANHELDVRLRDRTEEVLRLEGQAADGAGDRSDPFPEILGTSSALRRSIEALEKAASADFPVLLRGESGTGKDLAARALHRASKRAGEPFVAVPIAGLNAHLLEGELFGVARGAYTGADEDREGLLEAAGSGTLYLDGIDVMPIELQPKLLRVLEDGSYMRVGGGDRKCNARLVVASHRDLSEAVAEGAFREDLYYRIRVMEIVLPPLRERGADLKRLFDDFLQRLQAEGGVQVSPPGEEDWGRIEQHTWPGNIRELSNFVTRWVAFGGDLPIAEWERLMEGESGTARGTLREVADARLLEVLEEVGGNKAEAARRLGISRRTLYNRLKTLES